MTDTDGLKAVIPLVVWWEEEGERWDQETMGVYERERGERKRARRRRALTWWDRSNE